jgi:hypothetical protein
MESWIAPASAVIIGASTVLAAGLVNWWMADRRVRALQLAHITAVKEAETQDAPPPAPLTGSPAWRRARARLDSAHLGAQLVAAVTAVLALAFGVALVFGS